MTINTEMDFYYKAVEQFKGRLPPELQEPFNDALVNFQNFHIQNTDRVLEASYSSQDAGEHINNSRLGKSHG